MWEIGNSVHMISVDIYVKMEIGGDDCDICDILSFFMKMLEQWLKICFDHFLSNAM
jgi:hypothetical protein